MISCPHSLKIDENNSLEEDEQLRQNNQEHETETEVNSDTDWYTLRLLEYILVTPIDITAIGKQFMTDGKMLTSKWFRKPKKHKNSVLVPKTLRIDDPDDAAKSSIWSTLGIMNEQIGTRGIFKAFGKNSEENNKQKVSNASPVLQANPAALEEKEKFLTLRRITWYKKEEASKKKTSVILEAHGLWEAIEPKKNTQVDDKKDKATTAFLYQALTEDVILQVAGCETAKELWESLKKRHVGEERVQQAWLQSLMIGFQTLQMKEYDTMDAFTAKLNGYATKAKELGKTLDESLLV
ncbi:hypothetical protein Tco_0968462 [Tanacetum coccineum]